MLAALAGIALVAVLFACGYVVRGYRDEARIARELDRLREQSAAQAEALAEVAAERTIIIRERDSLEVLAERQRQSAERLGAIAEAKETRLRTYRDSVIAAGATMVPVAQLDTAIAVAEYRGEQLQAERLIATTLTGQLQAAARLRSTDSTEIMLLRVRAERAERALAGAGGLVAPSKPEGWPTGATIAVGAVTVASCAERILSAGCLSGLAVVASRL